MTRGSIGLEDTLRDVRRHPWFYLAGLLAIVLMFKIFEARIGEAAVWGVTFAAEPVRTVRYFPTTSPSGLRW